MDYSIMVFLVHCINPSRGGSGSLPPLELWACFLVLIGYWGGRDKVEVRSDGTLLKETQSHFLYIQIDIFSGLVLAFCPNQQPILTNTSASINLVMYVQR